MLILLVARRKRGRSLHEEHPIDSRTNSSEGTTRGNGKPNFPILSEILALVKLVGPYLLGFCAVALVYLLIIVVFVGAPLREALWIVPFVVAWGSIAALLGLRSGGGGGVEGGGDGGG